MKIENYKRVDRKTYNSLEDDLMSVSNTVNITKNNVLKEDATVFSCVDLIASTIASMGLTLYEKTDNGREKVEDDLAFLIKNRPNSKTNAYNFFRDLIKNMLIYKDAFAVLKVKKGQVVELEVLDGSLTTLEKTTAGVYVVKTTINNKNETLNYNSVIHISDIENRFEAIKDIVVAKKYCNNLISNYFKDGKTPIKGIIEAEGSLSNEAKKGLKRAFNLVLQDNSDGVGVLDDGLKYNSISGNKSFQEQQIKDLSIELDNEIFKIFRVPKSLVGNNADASSYNSLQALQESFVKSLQGFLIQIEQEFNYKCLTEIDRLSKYFKFNSKNAMRLTDTERIKYYKDAIQSGIMTIEEARDLEELNFKEGTESLLMSLNFVPLEKWEQYIEAKGNSSNTALDKSLIEE